MYTRPIVAIAVLLTACPEPTTGTDPIDPSTCTAWDDETSGSLSDDCYRLDGEIRVSNAITLSAGTVVVAAANASLLIQEQGSLRVNGTEDEPVRFEGVSSGAGTWRGIGFTNSPSGENVLSWLEIDGAGGAQWNGADESGGALFADGGTRVAADHITISSSASTGVNWWDEEVDATLDTLTITATVQAMNLRARHVDGLSGTFSLEGDDPTIHIMRPALTDDATMPPFDYTVDQGIDVDANLTIMPGATLSFAANAYMEIDGGSLNAEGTTDAPITLQGVEAIDGYWRGVHILTSPSTNNVWTHLSILHAGSEPWNGNDDSDASLYVEGENVRLTVTDSRIADSGAAGIYLDVDAVGDDITFERVAFDSTVEPVKTRAAGVGTLGTGHSFSNNDEPHIRVLGSDLDEDATWLDHGIDYVLPDGVRVYADLTLSPGTQLRFGGDAALQISNLSSGGTLLADADGASPIVFTGIQEASGYWKGIQFTTATDNSLIRNATIQYAGSSSWNGIPTNIAALHAEAGSRVELRDVVFGSNDGDSDVLATLQNTEVTGCTGITGTFRGDDDATYCTQ